MPYYRAFNLNFFSELAFSDQTQCTTAPEKTDVTITYGNIPDSGISDNMTHGYTFQGNKQQFWLNVPRIARFLVENGNSITIDPAPEFDKKRITLLCLFVLHPCLSVLLLQRGLFLLRASAIDIGSSIILLASDKGTGKSTFATRLAQQGHVLLSDDICVITAQGKILPGFSYTKLWRSTKSSPFSHIDGNSTLIPIHTQSLHAKPISAIYYLDPQPIQEIKMSRLDDKEKIFWLTLMSEFSYYPSYLRNISTLFKTKKMLSFLRMIPCIKIEYPQQPKWIDTLLQKIKNPSTVLNALHIHSNDLVLQKKITAPKVNRMSYIIERLKTIWSSNNKNEAAIKKIFWLASYPKSGNTWLRIFLFKIYQLSRQKVILDELSGVGLMPANRKWLDALTGFDTACLTDDEADHIKSDTSQWFAQLQKDTLYYKSHEAYTYFDDGEPRIPVANSLGAIYLVRNPLDVSISLASHYNCSIDDAIGYLNDPDYTIAGTACGYQPRLRQMYYSWSGHVKSWLSAKNIRHLMVRYEDMKRQPLETFTTIVNFLNLNVSSDMIKSALEETRFDKLKALEAEKGFNEAMVHGNPFFRKGIVGDWKNTLSQEQVDKIVNAHRDVMQMLGYLDENGQPI